MTDLGGEPTIASRLVVAALAATVVAVGAVWLWTTAHRVLVVGLPSWVVGLVLVALIVVLAGAVHRLHESGR